MVKSESSAEWKYLLSSVLQTKYRHSIYTPFYVSTKVTCAIAMIDFYLFMGCRHLIFTSTEIRNNNPNLLGGLSRLSFKSCHERNVVACLTK